MLTPEEQAEADAAKAAERDAAEAAERDAAEARVQALRRLSYVAPRVGSLIPPPTVTE